MLTTGSKFLIGATVAATISAIAYGITQDGVMGTVGLASAAVALAFLAGVNMYARDSNVWADELSTMEEAAAASRPPADSIWPFAFAVGAVALTVGLVTYQAVFTAGVVVLLVAGAEWATQAWAERASADAAYNAEVRSRIANPLEFPFGSAIGIGVIVFAFSRIMLWLSKTNTVIAFAVMGTVIIAVAFLLANRPPLKSRATFGAVGVIVLALVAGGTAAALSGQREIHPHETTGGLQQSGEDICSSPDAFDADKNASQSVGATANVAATVTLREDGLLAFRVEGPIDPDATLTLPRSNPNNIIFINNSDTDRRLSVDLTVPSDSATPVLKCTTLVEPGGSQNITITFGAPSTLATNGYYSLFVPGVDTAHLDVIAL